jgi:Domain of unknown function (DUF4878)
MKRTTLALLVFSLFVVSCGNSNSPKGIAYAFLECMQKQDIKKAKTYATYETQKTLDKAMAMMAAFGNRKDAPKQTFKILSDTLYDAESARVFYLENETSNKSLSLVNVDGKWKVHQPSLK